MTSTMNQFLPELIPDYRELLHNVEDISILRGTTEESFQDFRNALLEAIPANEGDLNMAHVTALANSVVTLAVHVYDALIHEAQYVEQLLAVLAMGTRTTLRWRTQFGGCIPNLHVSHEASTKAHDPDCILEVARRVCTLKYQVTSASITSALKIVANCCANDNENRRMIIHRNGIDTLVQLAVHDADADALIGALYNVCIDFNELSNILQPLDIEVPGPDGSRNTELLSLSVEHLALACRSHTDLSTFEAILYCYPKTSEHVWPYLAELVEMATQPALTGFEYIRANAESEGNSWEWTFTLNNIKHDTIATACWFVAQSLESLAHVSRAIVNLLSQQVARDALLERTDDAIWTLLTLACSNPNAADNEEELATFDGSLLDELSHVRRELLKVLYQITGYPSFCEPGERSSALISRCVSEMKHVVQLHNPKVYYSHVKSHSLLGSENTAQIESRPTNATLYARTAYLASACVIVSQLAASEDIRSDLISNDQLITALMKVLDFEESPDVLYPAVTIISRMALTSDTYIPIVQAGVLQKMRRLLTSGGLGLIVPFETVTAFNTIVRGRPNVIDSLLAPDSDRISIMDSMFTLWNLTTESGTRLEIGKFFLEFFRTALSGISINENSTQIGEQLSGNNFNHFLATSAEQIAEVFAWISTKAEPTAQRDHGWFGLAMLSIWPTAVTGICKTLVQDQDFRDAMINVSQGGNNATSNNLKLLLSKVQIQKDSLEFPEVVTGILHTAMRNCGLAAPSQG